MWHDRPHPTGPPRAHECSAARSQDAVQPLRGFFVATQPETPVTALKAGQWVYLADRTGWFELARDAEPGFTVLMGGGTHAPAVRLHLVGESKPLMFLYAAMLYTRRDEEGN